MPSSIPGWLTFLIGSSGFLGLLFGLLRYNREEAGKIVSQSSQVLADMIKLNDELKESLNEAKKERDELKRELNFTRDEVRLLKSQVTRLVALLRAHGVHE